MRMVKMSLMVLFHPITAFTYIQKERDNFKGYPIVIMLVLGILVRLFSLEFTHYPLSTISTRNANLMMECAKLFVPLISWVIASYAMTTILSGETMIREAMLAAAYSLVPYVLFILPLTLLSRIMESSQEGFFSTAHTVLIGWIILLMIINLKEMNHFSGGKTLLVIILSLFTVAVLWAAVALFFAISSQFLGFVKEVLTELKYKLY